MLVARSPAGLRFRLVPLFVSSATFRVKVNPCKEQLPSDLQKVLGLPGVWISITKDFVEVRPDQERMARVTKALQKCLTEDRLTPEEASKSNTLCRQTDTS